MHLLVIFKATITVVVIRLCKNIIQRCGNSVAVLQQIFYLWHCFHKTYEKKSVEIDKILQKHISNYDTSKTKKNPHYV